MGHYCFAVCRRCLSSLSVVVCNVAGRPQGAWERSMGMLPVVGPAGRRVGGRAADTAWAGQSCYIPLGRHTTRSTVGDHLRHYSARCPAHPPAHNEPIVVLIVNGPLLLHFLNKNKITLVVQKCKIYHHSPGVSTVNVAVQQHRC